MRKEKKITRTIASTHVDIMLCTGTADTGQDPHAVFSDNGDNSFHNKYLSSGRIDLDSGMIIS